jgi:hypothetical protein
MSRKGDVRTPRRASKTGLGGPPGGSRAAPTYALCFSAWPASHHPPQAPPAPGSASTRLPVSSSARSEPRSKRVRPYPAMGADDIPGQSKGKFLPSPGTRQPRASSQRGTEEDSCQELRMCSAPSKSRSCRARPYLPREPRGLLLTGSEGAG